MEVMEEIKIPFIWSGLLWKPRLNKFGFPTGYYSELNNLNIKLRGSELTITNSLQKFYMENNYDSFTYSQVVEAFECLNNLLPFNIYAATVKKVAMGVVIQEDPNQILNTWLSFINKKPFPMLSRNKPYGLKYFLTDYAIKGYNKTTEVKDHNNIKLSGEFFRFEVEVKRINNLNNGKDKIGIHTVQDLIDPIKYQKLANYLIDKYHKIAKKPFINLNNTTIKEKKLIAVFKDIEVLNSIKKNHPNSYKKYRQEYKCLTNKLDDSTFQNQVINKLNQQIQFSINN
ncbi:MAG: hypothetical protein APF83_01085 [Lutibacter sp. BRH_c52]|nr:MAG: hypothetical protein APF83_01085 [Lutibacter sp. BRH_c52]